MLVLDPLRMDLGACQCYMLPGPLVSSYKVTHILWLPLLGLSVCGKDQDEHQVWFLLTPGLGADQQNSQGPLRIHLHLPLPAWCLSGSVTEEPLAGLKVHETGSHELQVMASGVCQADAGSNSLQCWA